MKPSHRRHLRTAILVAAGLAILAIPGSALAQGCAMCSTVGQGKDDPLVKGMFASIMLMVSMPATLVLAVGGWFVHRVRSGRLDAPLPEDDAGPAGPDVVEFRRD